MLNSRLVIIATVALGSGCCPIPLPREKIVVPALDMRIQAGGDPLAAARVHVARFEYYPHFRPETKIAVLGTTDSEGRVVFEQKTQTETSMPLMMHGVPSYGWQLCAEADGHDAVVIEATPDFENAPAARKIVVELEPGDGSSCEMLLGQRRIYPVYPR